MSEINSIANGTFTIGQTSATNFVGGTGITIDSPSEGTVRIANDETVLYENTAGTSEDDGFTISELMTNFDTVKYYGNTNSCRFCVEIPTYEGISTNFRFGVACMCPDSDGAPLQLYGKSFSSSNGLTYTLTRSIARWFAYADNTIAGTQPFTGTVYKIVGINRISGSNE